MKSRLLAISILLIFNSCSTKYIFRSDRFESIGQLTIDKAVKLDMGNRSRDISPDHLVSIEESIYPNAKGFVLNTPRSFEALSGKFRLETNYYFTSDSSVKVILYQWDKLGQGDQKKRFHEQFDQLKKILTDKLGKPTEIEIQQNEFNKDTYRDGIKWIGKVNAYLFMFGNDQTNYRQIRLAIYGE